MTDSEDKKKPKMMMGTFDIANPDSEQGRLILLAVRYGDTARKCKIASSFLLGATLANLIAYAAMNNLLQNFVVLFITGCFAGLALALSSMAEKLSKESHNIFAQFAPNPPKD